MRCNYYHHEVSFNRLLQNIKGMSLHFADQPTFYKKISPAPHTKVKRRTDFKI